ncbi:MAG: hypothetical protein EOO75_01410 [Myxococcales bacterium]|nr:MAG: hypothetical protein EOO75_01410 [Myxococcales bacterium]
MTKAHFILAPLMAFSLAGIGCASTAAPFNQMKQSQVTVLQLQNYEPPAVAAAPAAAANPLGALAGMLPPGLLPQGAGMPTDLSAALPGVCALGLPLPMCAAGGGAAAVPVAANAPRFQGFRVIGQSQLTADGDKEDLGKLLGDKGNFDNSQKGCLYPEYGITFGVPANDLLVSLSCRDVVARSFAWPHSDHGLKDSTQKDFAEIVKKLSFIPVQ